MSFMSSKSKGVSSWVFPRWGVLLLFAVMLGMSAWSAEQVSAEEKTAKTTPPITWDESATAESLGLKPFTWSSDFYPLYPWDRIQWSGTFNQTIPEALDSMAECGFTMPAFVTLDEKELCASHGFRYMVSAELSREQFKTLTDEEADTHFKNAVAATKDDPNCLGYYLIDEPGASVFPGLGRAVAAIQKHAPGKLAYINLFPSYATTIGADAESQLETYSFTEYLERFVQEVRPQFISYDNYMVEYSEDMSNPRRAVVYYRDLLEVRRIALKYKLPWWNIVSSLCIQQTSSPPSPSRMAFQAYTSLAAGANGLGWFLYYPLDWSYAPIDKSGKRTLTWNIQRDVNQQTRTLGVFLNNYESTGLWFSESWPWSSEPGTQEPLPTNPGTLIESLKLSWSSLGRNIAETPRGLVGEFKAKEGSGDAVLIVNLDFGRSMRVEIQPVGEKQIETVSPMDGSVSAEVPVNGYWILPGHGTLFLLK